MAEAAPLYPDCLITVDTLGLRSNAAIVSLTAIRFDLDKAWLGTREHHSWVNPDSNTRAGRLVDAQSIRYWLTRDDVEVMFDQHPDEIPLKAALVSLGAFYAGAETAWVFGRGLDQSVLRDAFLSFSIVPPWNYWDVMCAKSFIRTAAWQTGVQVDPSRIGKTPIETARLRLESLRHFYKLMTTRSSDGQGH